MIKIAMIRHGKTYGNTLGRYIGVTDEPLCEEGKKELEQRTMDTVELLFVSPLKRCLETADVLYPYAKQVKTRNLQSAILVSLRTKIIRN